MKVTQTIQLDEQERLALQKAFSLIDKMSVLSRSSMNDVFKNLLNIAEISEEYEYEYLIKDSIEISEL